MVACMATWGTPAHADPNGAPTYRTLAGTGANVTSHVMDGLSDVVVDGTGTKLIASYDATGSAQVTTQDPATHTGCTINRPYNAGTGIDALNASLAANNGAGDGCLQFARASSNSAANYPGKNLTYIPFASDAVAYAVRADSSISRKLSLATLKTIYNCGGGSAFLPVLPAYGSGTRSTWLKKLGITDSATLTSDGVHGCISEVDSTGAPLVESTGNQLVDPRQIVPYSISEYLAQVNGVVPDIHGTAVLGQIDGIPPTLVNTGSTVSRDVYNVVPTSTVVGAATDPTYVSVFVGPNSLICQQAATIKKYGFVPAANCGDTSLHTN
jgi:hypothetical protein